MSIILDKFETFLKETTFSEADAFKYDINFNSLKEEFLTEYPLDSFKSMPLDDYCLGTQYSKDSLSYKLEFGKYKHLSLGVGGGTAGKFGIYYSSNDGIYKDSKGKKIEDPQDYWIEFRKQLYQFLVNIEKIEEYQFEKDFPLLVGRNILLLKLLTIYYPDLFISINKKEALISIYEYFEIEYDLSENTYFLSYKLNGILKQELKDVSINLKGLSHYLWQLYLKLSTEDDISEQAKSVNVWLYSPGENAESWDEIFSRKLMYLNDSIGDIRLYSNKDEIKEKLHMLDSSSNEKTSFMNKVLSRWQFANEMNIGDIVYAKKGRTTILGKGIIESEYLYDTSLGQYASHRRVNWLFKGIYDHSAIGEMPVKVLTEVSKYKGYPEKIEALFYNNEGVVEEYGRDQFLKEAFISDELYDSIINNLVRKKNLILQGPPGVGKTYLAKRLFYSLLGEVDDTRIQMVQFHQSYSYEDFVQGYRPNDEGKFELREGIFYKITQLARKEFENNQSNPKKFAIIIDEINRGNLSKILGELLMLIDADKRDKYWSMKLTYSDEDFYIPPNLYIIGTMNTADRSLSLVDYALRRRFTFVTLPTAFDSSKLKHHLISVEHIDESTVNLLISSMQSLNQYIKDTLGEGFTIGHSYFINQLSKSDDVVSTLNEIMKYEIIPLINEYYFDDKDSVKTAMQSINTLNQL